MDISCDICINVLIFEKDDHNLELNLKYYINHICVICVKG